MEKGENKLKEKSRRNLVYTKQVDVYFSAMHRFAAFYSTFVLV